MLQTLCKSHSAYPIHLAFPQGYMTLQGDFYRDEALAFLERFPSYHFIPYDVYWEQLTIVNQMSKEDSDEPHVLYGYKKEEFEQRRQVFIPNQTVKQKSPKMRMYEKLEMPNEGVVLDFEATTTITEFARIIEISALKFKDQEIVDEFHTFVNPGMKIPKAIRELTGIMQNDVDSAPKSIAALKDLLLFLKDCKVLVGHNIVYDYGLLKSHCTKFRLPTWQGILLCTKSLAKKAQIQVENYSLERLCKCFEIHNERPHRAWSDTRATFELMKHIYKDAFLL